MSYPQWPEITQSTFEVLKGNQTFLDDMKNETERMKKEKIKEVSESFPQVSEAQIEKTLEDHNWDVFQAIYSLIQDMEKQQTENKVNAEKERKDKQRDESKRFLQKMFESLPQELIQKTLDDFEGDVDIATTKLIEIVEGIEKDKRKERERETIVKTIWEKFRDFLSKQEVEQVLQKHNWDVKESASELLKLGEKRKVDRVAAVIQDVSRSVIEQTLRQKNWNFQETLATLIEERHKKAVQEKEQQLKKKTEEERQSLLKQQEDERKRKEEERIRETRRRAQEEDKRNKEEEEILKQEIIKLEAEKKHREEQEVLARKVQEEENRKRAEEQKLKEKEEQLRAQREQERREEEQLRADEERLIRSQVLANDLIQELDLRKEEDKKVLEEAKVTMKQELEVLLRSGLDGLPGFTQEKKGETAPKDQNRKQDPFPMNAGNTETVLKGVGVRLTAQPSEVDCGAVITVTWTVDQPPAGSKCFVHTPSTSDWIAMYTKGSDFKSYETWEWLPVAAKTGAIQFTAPTKVGELTFKYYSQKSFNLCAVSNTIALGPRFDMKVTPVSGSEKRTHQLSVKQLFGGNYPNAWVALYEKKSNRKKDSQYSTWQWVSAGLPSTNDAKEKNVSFDIPKAGQWEFRLFLQRLPFWGEEESSAAIQSVSLFIEGDDRLEFTVQPELNQVTVEYSISVADPKTDSVWIGIYHANQIDNRQHRRYKFISEQKGKITFKKLQHTGLYEARLFANNDMTVPLATSNSLEIQIP